MSSNIEHADDIRLSARSAGFVNETDFEEPTKIEMREFIYHPPREPSLVIKENFNCDQICDDYDRYQIVEKMPLYWSDPVKQIATSMIYDVIQCFRNREPAFKSLKILTAAELFFNTLKFFLNTKVADTKQVIDFFEEQLLRYAVEHPPWSFEIFDIQECFVVIQLFKDLFLQHLALLRAITSSNFTFKLELFDPELFVKKIKDKKKK